MKAPKLYRLVIPLLLVVGVLPTQAQEPLASGVVAVKAGRLLDVRSGNYLSDQIILIEAGKVREVGKARDVQPHVPPGAKVIDLSRYTVLPGLIDAHTHLTGTRPSGYRGLASPSRARR